MYVVRDTSHPKEDLKRNWSAPAGGTSIGMMPADSPEEALEQWASFKGISLEEAESDAPEFRFHDAYDGFVEVHYEGLGAFELEAETLEDALKEAAEIDSDLAVCSEAGDGHFFAEDVESFHKVSENRYVFKIF